MREPEPDRPYEPTSRTAVWRLALGVVGVAGIAYGVVSILLLPASTHPLDLLLWLVGALIVHDGILAPIVTVFGFAMARLLPGRARAYIQGGLIAGALVASFAVVEIYREGKSAEGSALLRQDYGRHLVIVLGVVTAAVVVLYVVRAVRDRRAAAAGP